MSGPIQRPLLQALGEPQPTIITGPMATLTHRGFRELLHDFGGWEYAVTEMTSAEALLNGTPFEASYTDLGPDPTRVVVQLTAYNPESFGAGAERFLPQRPAGIDLNMGCSAPKVRKRGGGAGWLSRAEEAVAAVSAVVAARERWENGAGLPGPALSAKLRLPREGDLSPLLRLIEQLAAAGIEWITLHGRRVGDPYGRPASWKALIEVAGSSPLPLCANGDIRSPEELSSLLEGQSFPAVMPARGVARRPWLPILLSRLVVAGRLSVTGRAELPALYNRAPAPQSYAETAERFHHYLEAYLPPQFWRTRARRFYAYFAANFPFGHQLASGSQSMRSYGEIKSYALELVHRWDGPLPL